MSIINVFIEQRDNIMAIMLSLLLHLVVFVQFSDNANSSQAQAPQLSTRVSLNLLPPAQQPQQPVEAERPKYEPVSRPKPKPIPKQKNELKPKERAPEKIEQLKPGPEVVPEQTAATKVEEKIHRGPDKDAALIRKTYLSKLLTYIEGHKYYPRTARRRGIEGNIEVTFELLCDGTISELKTSGGLKILRKSAEQSITKALPFETPPSEVDCPLQVSYIMQFELQQ